MVAHVGTVAFLGLDARAVDVQVQIVGGMANFIVVGLPDKAVKESRERVQATLDAIGLALPPKRIVVNLSPADLPKEGSHYDLPIALGLLAAMGLVNAETLADYLVVGELGLDGRIAAVPGVLLAALHASARELGLICPASQGGEAAWAGEIDVVAAPDLLSLINHLKGTQLLSPPVRTMAEVVRSGPDLGEIKGQETAKRALEIAAAGGHNLLMSGPPGSGKSLLAAALPGILPDLTPQEALEVSMIASMAGELEGGRLLRARPYRAPHHSASMPALVGGGAKARPGEVSLAHLGVLFLDELPEFQRGVLDSLRQPLETGQVMVARAAAHVVYPARVQLIAAMNPCPLRLAQRCSAGLFARAQMRRGLSGARLGTAARPHRPPYRCRRGQRRRPDPAAARRKLGAGRCTRRRGAPHPDRALRRHGGTDQCRNRRQGARGDRDARRGRTQAADAGGARHAAVGAGLYPRAARRPDARRSGGQRGRGAVAHRRSAELPSAIAGELSAIFHCDNPGEV